MPESQLLEGDQIKIGKQIVLPLSKAIEISLKSLKTRFWRSLITMGGIILAIAFLTTILATNTLIEGLKRAATTWSESEELELRERGKTLQELLRKKGYEMTGAAWEETGQKQKDEEAEEAAGLTKRQAKEIWLVSLAVFVAFVGIMNSMLMSVTERFKEIGTMKCLGALDSFIVKLFLLESSFQGALGTLIGITGGLLVTVFQLSIGFGLWTILGRFMEGEFVATLLVSLAFAFAVGAVVSVVGAIWPAVTAAKMQPVAAMRLEA